MSFLFHYMREDRKESILGPLFKLLEACFDLTVPLVVAAIIDRGIAAGDRSVIMHYSLFLVGLAFLGLLSSVAGQYFAAKASVGFVTRLRHDLFAHTQDFSYASLDEVGIPTIITRMTSDMNQIQTGMNLSLRLLLRSPFVVFGSMIMAFTIDAKAALWFLAVIPLLSLVVFGIMLVSMPLYRKVQEQFDRVLSAARENLSGVRVLRAFGKEEDEIRSFEGRNQALTDLQRLVGRISALLNPVTYVLINLAILLLIETGAIRVQAGILSQGNVVALYNYMSQILVELIKLANVIINLSRAIACGKRIRSILDLPAGEHSTPSLPAGDPKYRVAFENAGLQYSGAGADSLSGVSFRVLPGETVGIIGGTGSGKSTLVNLIPRFYEASEGRVFVDGKDVRSYDPAALRRKVGIVPQKAVVFRGTIRENLLWGREDADDDALWEAVGLAQADDVVSAKGGLDGIIEQGGRNLSGGQRQRLTIARALVRRPEILILDDSSSALDFATDAALRQSLNHLDYRPTVFLVSQRTSSIQHADLILVLEDGHVVGMGRHEELLSACQVYREIYDSQFRKEAAGE